MKLNALVRVSGRSSRSPGAAIANFRPRQPKSLTSGLWQALRRWRIARTPDSGIDALYHAHASRLLRFFSRRAGLGEAPDLVRETFVRMAGTEPAARQLIESPGAFLTSIATVRISTAVQLTGISRSRLYELIQSGDLETVKVGRSTLIPSKSLKALTGV